MMSVLNTDVWFGFTCTCLFARAFAILKPLSRVMSTDPSLPHLSIRVSVDSTSWFRSIMSPNRKANNWVTYNGFVMKPTWHTTDLVFFNSMWRWPSLSLSLASDLHDTNSQLNEAVKRLINWVSGSPANRKLRKNDGLLVVLQCILINGITVQVERTLLINYRQRLTTCLFCTYSLVLFLSSQFTVLNDIVIVS